ncbi:MAG TPA: hypothetical protein VLV83_09230 [Acidobacteriota bacterium]|nr:hypothetical protein [Acidobacteriota bacterium]
MTILAKLKTSLIWVVALVAVGLVAHGLANPPQSKKKSAEQPPIEPKFTFVVHPNCDLTKPERGTELMDINDFGQIVGGFSDKSGVVRGFLATDTGLMGLTELKGDEFNNKWKFHDIEIEGASFTRAYGLNNNGTIVGTFQVGTRFMGFRVTIQQVLDAAGRPIALYPSDVIDIGGINTQALGVNDVGTIVGGYTEADGSIVGYKLPFGGKPERLEVGLGNLTTLTDISDDGTTVGTYGDLNQDSGFIDTTMSVLLDGSLQLQANRTLGYNGTNSALGINNNQQIAGIVGESETCSGNISFAETGYVDTEIVLIEIPHRRTTAVAGLNGSGLIVGATDNDFGALVGFVGAIAQ